MTEADGGVDQSKDYKLRRLIRAGSEIVGAAAGGSLGFLGAGPIGSAAGGAAVSYILKSVGEEVADRVLGPRETVRVGAALAIASSHIAKRIERGEDLRQDDFFEPKHNGRSDAQEVAESVLLKCQREAEERKIPYIAFLIGNIAFDTEISSAYAHQLIRAAEALTYRQLCMLKLAALRAQYELRSEDYRGIGTFPRDLYEILYEFLDLYQRAFINFGGEVLFGPTDVKPGSLTIQGMGADLFDQMGLATIPQHDLEAIILRIAN